MIFIVVKDSLGICKLPEEKDICGADIDLECVMTWMVREMRLHKSIGESIEVNIKLDGRPFWGKSIK